MDETLSWVPGTPQRGHRSGRDQRGRRARVGTSHPTFPHCSVSPGVAGTRSASYFMGTLLGRKCSHLSTRRALLRCPALPGSRQERKWTGNASCSWEARVRTRGGGGDKLQSEMCFNRGSAADSGNPDGAGPPSRGLREDAVDTVGLAYR